MDEILALQRQLAQVQVSTSAAKLSERNCIELVMKLQSLAMVDLIFTRTGREYLTPAQLSREIADEIFVRGGRVNVIDLPDALNVDLAHVHAALPAVLAAAPVPTRVVNGEVVTDDYLATLAADIDAALAASPAGVDDVGAIAGRTNLPVAVVRDCVAAHVGGAIRATLDRPSGVLRSHASRTRAEAAARGALRAAATPAPLADVADRHGAPLEIVADVAAAMLAAGRLRGRVDGTAARAVFVPAVFERAAHRAALSDFAVAGFVTVDKLRALSVPDPPAFAREHLPGAALVGAVIVGRPLLEAVEGSAVEAIASGSWLDVAASLPAAFPPDHLPHIVGLLDHAGKGSAGGRAGGGGAGAGAGARPRGGKGASKRKPADGASPAGRVPTRLEAPIYRARYLVSGALLDRCWACVRQDADARAKARAKTLSDMMAVVGAPPPPADAGADEDAAAPAARKGKARRRRDKPAAAAAAKPGGGAPVAVPPADEVCLLLQGERGLRDAFTADYLGNGAADGGDVVRAIVEEGLAGGADQAGIAAVYEAAAAAAVVELERERGAARASLERQIVAGLERAELFSLTASTLRDVSDGAVGDSLAHVLETVCVETTLAVLNFAANSVGAPGSPPGAGAGAAAIRDVGQRLPSDVAHRTRALVSLVASKKPGRVDDFLQAYDACSEALDLPPRRPLDKRRERASSAALRAALDASLAAPSQPSIQALSACAVLLHARRVGGAVVCLPPALVPAVCESLERGGMRAEGAGDALSALRKAVTAQLRDAADGGSGPVISDEVRPLVEAVRRVWTLQRPAEGAER